MAAKLPYIYDPTVADAVQASVTDGFNSYWDFVTVTAATQNETATNGTRVVLCNCTSNSITVNLPTAVGNKCVYIIKKIAPVSAALLVTVDAAGTETIDEGLTAVIKVKYASITLISDNANWWIV